MKHALASSLALALVVMASSPTMAQNAFPGGGVAPPAQQQSPRPLPPAAAQQPTQPGFDLPPAARPSPAGQGVDWDALMAAERKDFGVPPSDRLHQGPMHGPTPASIPGGQLVTTKGLQALVHGGQQVPFLLFDVLGSQEVLPGAIPAVPAGQPGNFDDETQRGFGNYLNQATRGDQRTALVFYCQSTQCWMSYNAALRAIKLGYGNVLWYRGGIEAWKSAGLPTQRAAAGRN